MNFMEKVIEIKDTQSHAYLLESSSLFFPVGYKVLLGQEKNGFIKCNKVSHNGKDKLIYDTSKFKTLESLLPVLSLDMALGILTNFLDSIISVKSNGFMQCENILISPDHIFIDCDNNYSVNLIYLPIYHESDNISFSIFEGELKTHLIFILSNYTKRNSHIQSLCANMNKPDFTIEDIYSVLDEGLTKWGVRLKDKMMSRMNGNSDMLGSVKKFFSFSKNGK